MARKIAISSLFILVCLFGAGTGAEDQPQKKVMKFIAVMNLTCGEGIKKEACNALTDMAIEELVEIGKTTGKFTVIDRANRDKILSEQGFQQKGCVEESCTVDAGRLLGVGRLIVGSISKVGETYIVNLQIINVQTAAVDTAKSEKCKCDIDGLIDTVRNVARKLMGEAPVSIPSGGTQQQPATVKPGEMVKVPAGEFTMGSDSGGADEKPVHRVSLDEFQIDKYEVTNEQYNQCMSAGPCSLNKQFDGFTDPQQPVVGVDWNQASRYCTWAGKRLPTEAEWEKAARGADGRTYPWGEGIDCSKANYGDCKHGKTKPVGSYPSGASPYGAMDMAGNAWEWVADWYDKKYYTSSPNRNPTGPASGSSRVLRGGSWSYFDSFYLRTSARSYDTPGFRSFSLGFRCSRTP